MLHELEVHQIELEMQNAELQKVRYELEGALGKYTDLYDFAPVGYCSLDESGLILEANLTGADMLGVERSRLIKRRLLPFLSAVSRPAYLAFLERVFSGTRDQVCEVLLLKESGGTMWAALRATAPVALKGTGKWCRVTFGDITARKEAEENLRTSEARFRALFELGPVAVYSCDASGVIREFNRHAAELWGREPASGQTEARFCGSFKLFRPDGSFMPHQQCPMAEVLSGKITAAHDAEVLIERPDGSRITVIVNIRPLKNQRGELTGAINCFYDITKRKRVEAAQRRLDVLTASNRKLEQEIRQRQAVETTLRQSEQHQTRLLEQLRQLSHQILHAQEEERKRISRELHDEIAQTLVGINIHLAALTREAEGHPMGLQQKIAQTQRLVQKSVEVVHRFARELRPTTLDDLGLVPALHAFMREFTKRTGIRIHFTTFTPGRIKQLNNATRTVFYRVAQEALTNVARHAKASLVEVSLQKLPGAICLKIKDNGKSFRVRHVLHPKRNKRLGLLGMRERLEMVGGTFSIESARGKGTTVRARIPLPARLS